MRRALPPTRASQRRKGRVRAETSATTSGPTAPPARPATELAHELQVHQIELEMQNEELRRTQAALEAARDRYLNLYDFAPVGYFTLNADGLIVEANLTGAQLLGLDRARLVGSRFAQRVASADRDRWYRHALALARHDGPARIELAMEAADGRHFDAQIDGVRAAAPDPAPALRITLTDITERRRAETELRIAATAFDTQEGIMITDARGVIERVNRAFTRITGYGADEAVGHTGRLLQSGRHDTAFYEAMWDSLQRTDTWQGEVWNRRKDGELYPQWLTITGVRDDAGAVMRYVGTLTDISQRKAREDEVVQLAFYDALTGLPNRRLMKDRLHQALAVSARTGREGALMFIDLDHFKKVNDRLGHDKGDLLLQQVARRLTACVREGDTVARLGGDEFVVMLAADLSDEHTQAAAQAKAVAEKVLAALNRPYELTGHELHGSASIGITLFSDHHSTVDDQLKRADQAMYLAKAAGRNTLRFFDAAIQEELRLRSTLESELRQAVQQGEFVLYYQPVVDRDRRLLGAEVLLRWQHPRRGLVLPGEFIGCAEDTGLIQVLGRWVLEAACGQLAAWARAPRTAGLSLSVNVSARQLRDRRFVDDVLDGLDRTGAKPNRLKLELTEGMLLDSVEDSIAKMHALRSHGVSFSLDDFGTGYASLAYVRRLPLNQLKIDRSFVRDMLTVPHDAAIARTIVDLGRSLGLTVVAEGVETQAQHDFLVRHGCHAFQGFLFGRPAPVEALQDAASRSVDA